MIAVELANGLMAERFAEEQLFTVGETGRFAANPKFGWQVVQRPSTLSNPRWLCDVFAIEVYNLEDRTKPILDLELVGKREERGR